MQVSLGYVIIDNDNRVIFLANFKLKFCNTLRNFHIPASMKTKQVCIWSAFWILLKPGVQVSIRYCIIENENSVKTRPPKSRLGQVAGNVTTV
jgi:hypothetical protein